MTRALTILQSRVRLRDPQDCTDQADDLSLLEALFDALVRRGRDGGYLPALAESWSLSEDARTWTFRLKPNLRFHDGRPADAEAAAWSIRRMQRPDIGATLGAPAVWGQYLGDARIEATGARTVRIETPKPTADLLDVLVSGYVLPPDLADRPEFIDAPVGTGAYRAVKAENGEVRMEAHGEWHGGKPTFDVVAWREVPDAGARVAAVRANEADIATRVSPDVPGAVAHVDPVAIIFILNAAQGPFADPRLRRAINLAIDRRAIVDAVLDGAGAPLNGYVSTGHFGADPDAASLHDLEGARRLIAEAGFDGGLEITVDRPTSLPDEAAALTDVVTGQLAKIGIAAKVRVHENRVAYAEAVRDKQIGDMCLFDSSPMSVFRVINEKADSRWRGSWWQGYANAAVEELLDRARRTPDTTEREAIYRKAFRELRADPPWLYLYNRVRGTAFAGGAPEGWRIRNDGVLDITDLPGQ